MKNHLLLILLSIFICSCSSTGQTVEEIRYFDENNKEISKSKFNRIRSTNKVLNVPGDAANQRKLIPREERGTIADRPSLEKKLEEEIQREIDATKPLVIIFHPGEDACNSSGSFTKEGIEQWYDQLESGLEQIAGTLPVYVYRDRGGLEKYEGIIEWHQDPDAVVENLFFEHHYPCSSFVVISENGEYISYFGEFMKEFVWEATEVLNQ